jgi:hypothetical protein
MRSGSVIIGDLPDGHLLCGRRAADLAYRHMAEGAHQVVLPFGWQRLPDRTGQPNVHRVIQASAPRRTVLEYRVSAARRFVSNYQRCPLWDIEPQFRDTKDLQFGMGLSSTRIGEPTRRDRLLLISAFATALLTLLGAVGESLGMDRLLKSNTSKTRTHSLFRQGCMLYDLIPNMPKHRLLPLMQKFNEAISNAAVLSPVFVVVQ